MDTKSKTVLLIAFALVGAFILGGMTATVGLAMTRVVAGAMADGPGFAHGRSHMDEGTRGRFSMPGHMEGDFDPSEGMRGRGMDEYRDKGMRGPSGMMPGPYGETEEYEGAYPRRGRGGPPAQYPDVELPEGHPELEQELGEVPEDARYGAECPVWGTF